MPRTYVGGLSPNANYSNLLRLKKQGVPLSETDINQAYTSSLGNYANYALRNAEIAANRKQNIQQIKGTRDLEQQKMEQANRAATLGGVMDTALLAKELYGSKLGSSIGSGIKGLFSTTPTYTNPAVSSLAGEIQAGGGGANAISGSTAPVVAADAPAAGSAGAETTVGGGLSWQGGVVTAGIALGDYLGRKNPQSMGAIEAGEKGKLSFTDPFPDYLNYKLGLDPSGQSRFSKAFNQGDTDTMLKTAPLAMQEWAYPGQAQIAGFFGKKLGPVAQFIFNPVEETSKMFIDDISDWF